MKILLSTWDYKDNTISKVIPIYFMIWQTATCLPFNVAFEIKCFDKNIKNGYTKYLPKYQPISDISHLYVVINWEHFKFVPNCNNYSFMHFDQLNLQKIWVFFRVIAMICRSTYWHIENNFTLLNLFVYIQH